MEERFIRKETYRTKVYARLREMIISGELLPGQTITLRGLSSRFGVSVAPVREALVQLESEKAVLRHDNRDYRINTLTETQFEEIFRIRRILEPYLGNWACSRRPASAVTEATRIFDSMKRAQTAVRRFIALNHGLHFLFYSCAEHEILLEIVSHLWTRIGPYLTLNFHNQDMEQTLATHAAMLAAFANRDAKAFRRHLLADMEFSRSYVVPYITVKAKQPEDA